MSAITFNVIEETDAASFFIYNTGSTVAVELTLTVTDPDGDDYTYTIEVGDDLDDFNSDTGLELTPTDLSMTDSTFEDGLYTFVINDGANNSTWIEGFAAVITEEVMQESLSYRIYQTLGTKEYIEEKMRLLNNLYYASKIGSTAKFTENLEILERMQ